MNRRDLIKGIAAAAVACAVAPAAVAATFSTDSMRYVAWERIGNWCWRPDSDTDDIMLRYASDSIDGRPLRISRKSLDEYCVTIYDVIWHLNEFGTRLRKEIDGMLYGSNPSDLPAIGLRALVECTD